MMNDHELVERLRTCQHDHCVCDDCIESQDAVKSWQRLMGLAADRIEALTNPVPNRVLTLEEIKLLVFPCALWTEYREGDATDVLENELQLEVLKDVSSFVVHFQPLYGAFVDDYFKSWRCWLRKPTDEERAAAPWGGEKHEQ